MKLLQPNLSDGELQGLGILALAHVGDGVYELMTRTRLCLNGAPTARKLHRATVQQVCAPTQAKAARLLQPLLTEEEAAVFRRGRNAKTHKQPKAAEGDEYQLATALEALFGYLYLLGRHDRLQALMDTIQEATL